MRLGLILMMIDYYQKKAPCTVHSVTVIDFVYKTVKGDYLQIHLEGCKYMLKNTIKKYITKNLSVSDSDLSSGCHF